MSSPQRECNNNRAKVCGLGGKSFSSFVPASAAVSYFSPRIFAVNVVLPLSFLQPPSDPYARMQGLFHALTKPSRRCANILIRGHTGRTLPGPPASPCHPRREGMVQKKNWPNSLSEWSDEYSNSGKGLRADRLVGTALKSTQQQHLRIPPEYLCEVRFWGA